MQEHRGWKTVVDGRAYVRAYVAYIHYVETVHAAIVAAASHEH